MINVTKTYLPPLEEYIEQLRKIWESGHVTNNGPLLLDLEEQLKQFLGVKHLFLTANGTLGLQIALKALEVTGRVITTPFSYVATTGSLLWEQCTPVFADINESDFCIDPNRVESLLDEHTQAILAVHVYGYSCDVHALADLGERYSIPIIYDAAHAFGARLGENSLASYGDVSVLSFHATKLFHTVEGGAVITNDDNVARKIRLFRAFGHIGDEYFTIGINAKNSELHAAMGLCTLPHVQEMIEMRHRLSDAYDKLFSGLPVARPRSAEKDLIYNYAYYPVVFPNEAILLTAQSVLQSNGVIPRRYFYPSLNQLPYRHGEKCPVAEDLSPRVLCLPLSHQVTPEIQRTIANIIKESIA